MWVVAVAVFAAGLTGCTQFQVRSRQDPAVDFARLGTYAWLPADQAEPADQRVNDRGIDRRIRAAVEEQMRAKGYQPADAAPDFLLNYRLSMSPGDAVLAGRRGYVGDPWMGWYGANAVYDSHDDGTLYVAAVNPETKRMIWVGGAQARILPHLTYEKRAKRAQAAVEKLLAAFPKR
jgi:hypothetical protein